VTIAYVGLGANLGPRQETLARAVALLAEADDVEVVATSQLRETAPVGVVDQPGFLNGAVAVETTRTARELLDLLLEIERSRGRVRAERWGPRTIDLDLLVYGPDVVDEPGLRVPHARLHERRFALDPLADLDPDLEIPGLGKVSAVLAALD
jgi:2-amino-4-hydroxy-6-hydroxymethyldihydropteridine diphosphokinase